MLEFLFILGLVGLAVYLVNKYSSYLISCRHKDSAFEQIISEQAKILLAQAEISRKTAETKRKMMEEALKQEHTRRY